MIKIYKTLDEAEAKDDGRTKFIILHTDQGFFNTQIIFLNHMFWELEDGQVPRNTR